MAAHSQDSPHFLVVTDLTPESKPHVGFAVRLAEQLGARATLFHVVLPLPYVVNAPLAPTMTQVEDAADVRRELERLAASFAAKRPVHVAVTEAADVRSATLVAAERIDAAMIVLPTHGRSGLARAVLGSTAEQVLRRAHRPVLLLTDRMLQGEAEALTRRGPVVVATDLSPQGVRTHAAAATLAHRLGRAMLLVSVLPAREPPAHGGGAATAPQPGDPQLRARDLAAQLRRHAADIGHERPVDVLALVDDDVAGAIVRAAREQEASLLVLTTHGRRGIGRLLKGSVAEQVIRHATVPVVCMPWPEE